ncbi:MAG: hypothetical protein BZY88_13085 [SAR202 cluster bacterium Io17-Chloro-G9]|nr:MAG: hypothetical protein BZY88_13085 [SAR202 cluster bacterium Io17-Chloro-G9]
MNRQIAGVNTVLQGLALARPDLWSLSVCGVTPGIQSIPALVAVESYLPESNRVRLLAISGLRGGKNEADLGLAALERFNDRAAVLSPKIAFTSVPWCNPDGNHDLSSGYPPQDNFYNDPRSPERRYLWRWVCFQAPDLLLEIRCADSVNWSANPAAAHLQQALGGTSSISDLASLPAAVGTGSPSGLAPIPGLILETPPENLVEELDRLWDLLSAGSTPAATSPARRSLESRQARPYMDVARTLASVYGYQLDPVNYTQGVGISGRLRLAALEDSSRGRESPAPGIRSLVEPYVSGSVEMFGERAGGANLAGLIWGEELTEASGDPRYAGLIVDVADRYRSGEEGGAPPPCDPDFRTEDMFMAAAMLGRAFAITGQSRYLDLLVKFLINGKIQQNDGPQEGLFWHCRSAPFYWGRGNGFAAMGLTETLTFLPGDHSDRDAVLAMYRKLLDALGRIQGLSGMLPQVLDIPGSYPELTATCMYGYALARGLRLGWLDPSYRAALDLAWMGVSQRVDESGNVVDGCASTGVQSTLKEYLDRPAVFGFDDRTGGMALWFAVEMERLRRGTSAV